MASSLHIFICIYIIYIYYILCILCNIIYIYYLHLYIIHLYSGQKESLISFLPQLVLHPIRDPHSYSIHRNKLPYPDPQSPTPFTSTQSHPITQHSLTILHIQSTQHQQTHLHSYSDMHREFTDTLTHTDTHAALRHIHTLIHRQEHTQTYIHTLIHRHSTHSQILTQHSDTFPYPQRHLVDMH